MGASGEFLVWVWGDDQFGLPVSQLDRIVQMVEVKPLPDIPDQFLGIINVEGELVPVLDVQASPSAPPVGSEQQLILARASTRRLGLRSSEVLGLFSVADHQCVPAAQVAREARGVQWVLKLPGGLVLVPDLEMLLQTVTREAPATHQQST